MPMTFADEVFLVLGKALSSVQLAYLPISAPDHVTSVQAVSGTSLSLFEYLTMNPAPEKRAQEALLPYLVAAGFHVKRECRMRIGTVQRVFDFVVRPGRSGDDNIDLKVEDYVIVEIKHLGAHQSGGFGALLGPLVNKAGKSLSTLHSDYKKARPAVPMIQVGLFTAVHNWGPVASPVHWTEVGSPFVQRYVKSKKLPKGYLATANLALNTWELNRSYTRPASWPATSCLNVGPTVSYQTFAGVQLSGCVHYFLGITI